MDTTTRLGSRVIIESQDQQYLYGRWFDGVDTWYPARWDISGHYWNKDIVTSLDLKLI